MNEVEARQEAVRILRPEGVEVREIVLKDGAGNIVAVHRLPEFCVKAGEEVELLLKLHFEG